MSAIVDYTWYVDTYMGTEADEVSFPALCARAEDVVLAMMRWKVTEDNLSTYPSIIQTLIKKAICAQVDYFAVNGLDSVAGGSERGFTVGKVTLTGKSGGELTRKGAMAEHISPLVLMYLEQTGLIGPQVPTAPDMPLVGWWF